MAAFFKISKNSAKRKINFQKYGILKNSVQRKTWEIRPRKTRRKAEKFFEKRGCNFILCLLYYYLRDCDRYAMKREVAAETCRFFRGVCPISNRATQFDTLSGSYGSGARNHALISKAHRPDKKGRSMVFYEGFVILHRPKSIPDFTKVNIRFLYGFLVKHPGQCS